jgi:uncharacterized protein
MKKREDLMREGLVIVDSDRHVIEPDDLWLDRMPAKYRDIAPYSKSDGSSRLLGGDHKPPGKQVLERYDPSADRFRDARESGYDAASGLADMDKDGIDVSVMFPSTGLLIPGVMDVDPSIITAAATAYNTWLAEFMDADRNRLFGVALLDLRDVEGACAEAERCVNEYGFVGAFFRPNVVEKPLHDSKYQKLWATLADLDIPACFHEGGRVAAPQIGPAQVGERRALWHTCTHPMEQQAAMVSIVLGGVLERNPSLRCAFLECGSGWLPYWMWRMDEHAEVKLWNYLSSDPENDLSLTPSEYVRRQCFVSIDTEEWSGADTIRRLGGNNVLWASDYPHNDSIFPGAVDTVLEIEGVERASWEKVMADNPAELFRNGVAHVVNKLKSDLAVNAS